MYFSPDISEIAPVLVKALANPPSLLRSTKGQAGGAKYKYLPLDEALEVLRPHFAAFDLAILQPAAKPENPANVKMQTVLLHRSGQWVACDGLELPAPKQDPQGFGSAVTYSRRYGLLALLGLAQEDDDGASATSSASKVTTTYAKAAAPKKAPKAVALDTDAAKRAVGAVVELVEAQGRDGSAALTWIQALPDPEKGLKRTVADAKKGGVEREKAETILKSYSFDDLIEEFDATEIPA